MAKGIAAGLGFKRILLMLGGAVVVFLASVPICLYSYGMLSLSAPHLRPAAGYAMADSLTQAWREARTDTVETDGDSIRQPSPAQALVETGGKKPRVDGPSPESTGEGVPAGGETLPTEGTSPGAAAVSAGSGAGDAPVDATGGTTQVYMTSEGDTLEPLLPFDEQKLGRLVSVYEKMRPKQVALILSTMPERQAVMILSRMKDNNAAKVLAELEPGKAARISQVLVNWSGHER